MYVLILVLALISLGVAIAFLVKTCCKSEKYIPIYAANAGNMDTSMQGGIGPRGLQKCTSRPGCPIENC